MYRRIWVDSHDADYQRIFWRESPADPMKTYRLLTVTYGTSCAPFLALRTIKQLAADEGSQFPLALPVLVNQTYVDDCLFGADDSTIARDTRNQLIALLARGGFPIRKWASNDPSLLTDIDPADHGLARSKALTADDSLKILGISWQPDRDRFTFQVSRSVNSTSSKRAILSAVAQLFDPMGWIAPVVITAKILIQRLWLLKRDWDDNLLADVSADWAAFRTQLPMLENLVIPRWTQYYSTIPHAELHGFADASNKAYAAAVYLRITNADGNVVVSLVTAQSKVAPIKTQSIPRLELCAALLLSRLLIFVRNSLKTPSISSTCWTDSTVTLTWVRHPPSRWCTFAANRVAKIQEAMPEVTWRHVSTGDNPADCASRGQMPEALRSHPLWWSGPAWLKLDPSAWPELDAASLRLTNKRQFR